MVRKRQRLYKYAVDTFIELMSQVLNRRFKYKCNAADVNCWEVFMNTFSDSIGEEFVKTFVEYGVQSWFNSGSPKDYSREIRFNWIFGGNAIKRWNKFGIKTNIAITRSSLKQDFNINIEKVHTSIPKLVIAVRDVEENFKSEYLNTRRGFLWCVANTTLYFHKSSKCIVCKFKQECKELLHTEYPKIYTKRGYGEK